MTTRDRILLSLLLYNGKTSYQNIYSFLPPSYKRTNFYAVLRRMEENQLIRRSRLFGDPPQRRVSSIEPLLRLGPDAMNFLETRFGQRVKMLLDPSSFRRAGTPQDDQGKSSTFSLVIYDFPLDLAYQRARLQTKLSQLGMGSLRKGVYVSLYDTLKTVASWAEENKILQNIYLTRTVLVEQGQSLRKVLDKAWDLTSISKKYLSFLERLAIVKGQQLPEKRIFGLKRIKTDFLEVLAGDPLLPKEFLPSDWPLTRVKKELLSIH